MDEQPDNPKSPSPKTQKVAKHSQQAALAMELPFTIVGAVLLGGLLGYFLDRWLHTKMIFIFVLGALGFAGGIKEVLRRLSQSDG